MDRLPVQAEATVERIEALLGQAEPLLGDAADEGSYAIRETRRRYLPETLKVYRDIPLARRDARAGAMLVEQLELLERATAQHLARLGERSERALAANGDFLATRFPAIAALKEPVSEPGASPLGTVRYVLSRMLAASGASTALLDAAGARLAAAYPAIVSVKRAAFDKDLVESVAVDVPRSNDTLRYLLVRDRFGAVTIRERHVGGVRLRAEMIELSEWSAALLDDLATYARRGTSALPARAAGSP